VKRYEKEAILKNFTIFFALQAVLLLIIYLQSLSSSVNKLDNKILENMKLCSYTLECKEYSFDFVPKQKQEVAKLMFGDSEIYSLFHIPKSNEFLLKISLDKKSYEIKIKKIKRALQKEFLLYAIIVALLSLLFSFYTLYPLKRALNLKKEFLKDILHDYNTPISSLIINFKLLKKEIGENSKIERMQRAVETILSLQNNLKYFVNESPLSKEVVDAKKIVVEKVENYKMLYPTLNFSIDLKECKIVTNKDAFVRVVENLLSNACKHNIKRGYVKIYAKDSTIYFENSTKGIKNPDLIFKREYKEHQRGSGLGLDIVYNLTKELNIKVDATIKKESVIFTLNLSRVIKR